MSVLKFFLLSLFAIVLIGAVFVAQSASRFDLFFNPIVQEIKTGPAADGWGKRVQLLSTQFERNENRKSVMQKLKNAGFERTPDNEIWARYDLEIENGRELYTREASDLVCRIKIYVFVAFNASDELVFAEGTQHEHGCL